ncbi:recombinase family protein [Enterococcus sp. BWB1-3]|uniref:recombinase family protein n=1 Tax=Enterococcus sp. BWB1-3 TaxID=2787713 RepID=UPI0019219A6D|nr:recombinase family protein [Enterococcus sp. BWB1-3]MBL1228197.1 recombinase family protein [Enterococcus sp. BWB1-3]
MERTAIYVRVSTLEQAEGGYSIDQQIEKLKQFCEIKDWNIAQVYKDPGFTGSNTDRPALTKLIKDVKLKNVDTVLVYKLDRLSRSQKDTLYLIEDVFLKNDVAFVSLSENFDTNTPFGKAMIGILAVFAQLEREQIRERMTMGKIGRAKSGKPMSWIHAPFGYKLVNGEYVKNELEAAIVKQVFDDYLSGISITKLRDKLNSEGHIAKDIPWSYRTIRQTLDNPTYAGYTKYKDQRFPGNHEEIISKETFDLVQNELVIRQKKAYERNNNPRPFQTKYLVSGLVRCGYCGSIFELRQYGVKKDGTRTKKYFCVSQSTKKNRTNKRASSCSAQNYSKDFLEQQILGQLEKFRISPSLIDLIVDKPQKVDTTIYKKRIKELNSQLEKLINLYLEESIPLEILNNKREVLQKEKSAIEDKLDKTESRNKDFTGEDAKNALANIQGSVFDLEYEVQKNLVNRLIEKITIKDDKMDVSWKFK